MFLTEPGRTAYDLNFSLFGFPVRVHPAFLILPLLLGAGLLQDPNTNAGVMLVLLIIIFFVSILVHELGHAVAFKYFGQASRIVIYWMGGLAIPDQGGNIWSQQRRAAIGSNQQIIISLAGPCFGLLLAGLIVGLIYLFGGKLIYVPGNLLPWSVDLKDSIFAESAQVTTIQTVLFVSLFVNVVINVLNLVPVYPLDGGQVARQVFLKFDSYNGIRYSMIFSIVFAILIALFTLNVGQSFAALFFGFMAWSNYRTLQQMSGGMGGGRSW